MLGIDGSCEGLVAAESMKAVAGLDAVRLWKKGRLVLRARSQTDPPRVEGNGAEE